MNLKDEQLAVNAHAAQIGVDGTVTEALNGAVTAIEGYASNVQNNAYIASPPDVQAMLDKVKALVG